MKAILYPVIFVSIISCVSDKSIRQTINLEGTWEFALDTADAGITQTWFSLSLHDSVMLPGTTDSNLKGFKNKDTTTLHLNRVFKYEGVAWYRKKVVVPDHFKNKHIVLHLERTKPCKIWVDGIFAGTSSLLQSPQEYDLSELLTPGEHFITLRIDNSLKLTPYGNVHIYSDDTQTNWNGVIGDIFLEASEKTFISNLQVYPDIEKKTIDIRMEVTNGLKLENAEIFFYVKKTEGGKTKKLKPMRIDTTIDPEMSFTYNLASDCSLWDDYNQPVYQLRAVIKSDDIRDEKTVPFGMRKFSVSGTQFTINNRITFLRGKHEAAVFPLTGYTPADVESWLRVYRIAKSYGINHYRFHSYCPPEAAFIAADMEGIFLQAELPFWGGLESDTIAQMQRSEGFAILKAYANHPSFVMFSHGNEIWSGHDRVEANIIALKEYDPRPLYTMGSNNNIGYVPPRPCSDFFVGARTPYAGDTTLTHLRLTHCFADSRSGGILNTEIPSTDFDLSYAAKALGIPVVSHEIGQYQIYPDYSEIEKYTGVLRAWNLEVFRKRLQKAGMPDYDKEFQKASGAWSALCYKAEMEAALRTEGLAGFQLLDLQDFPGQGTALVGILDAFMDSKEVISREAWLQSCNDVVILLEFPKYCYSNSETYRASCKVVNYSSKTIQNDLIWEIRDAKNTIIQNGNIPSQVFNNGKITDAGVISAALSSIPLPEKLTLTIKLEGTSYLNSYPLWVYPDKKELKNSGGIIITETLEADIIDQLRDGGNVLFFPKTQDIKANSLPGLFPPDFWNYGMFKGISEWVGKPVSPGTLSILTNPEHMLFNSFPTDFHANWQWFSIIKAGNALILDSLPIEYRPIIQVIDNLERNHKLGLVFEFKVGEGKLLVCMPELEKIRDQPEVFHFYQSILDYMASDNFNPEFEINTMQLKSLFGTTL